MCNFFSAIVLKNGEMIYDLNTSSHENLIEKAGIKDDTADADKLTFARIEITPKDGNVFVKKKDWYLKIDQSIIPVWFSKELERKCIDLFFTEVYPLCIFIDKKDLKFKNRKNLFLKDSSAKLYDLSSIEIHGSSSVILYGSSSVILYGSSSAELYGSSSARLYDSSSARLHNSSSAELHDSSSARLHGWSSAELHDSSSAVNFSKEAKFKIQDLGIVVDRSSEDIGIYSKKAINSYKI